MTTTIRVYKSYSFKDKDPVIDEMRTMVEDSKQRYKAISDGSSVSVSTLRGWFDGKTRKPQSATVEAVGRYLGFKRTWVRFRK